jgi:hypothetical protein
MISGLAVVGIDPETVLQAPIDVGGIVAVAGILLYAQTKFVFVHKATGVESLNWSMRSWVMLIVRATIGYSIVIAEQPVPAMVPLVNVTTPGTDAVPTLVTVPVIVTAQVREGKAVLNVPDVMLTGAPNAGDAIGLAMAGVARPRQARARIALLYISSSSPG